MKNCYILLTSLLFAIVVLIAVSIYCCIIKYQAKQKYLLLFHEANIKKIVIKNININIERNEVKEIYITNRALLFL